MKLMGAIQWAEHLVVFMSPFDHDVIYEASGCSLHLKFMTGAVSARWQHSCRIHCCHIL